MNLIDAAKAMVEAAKPKPVTKAVARRAALYGDK